MKYPASVWCVTLHAILVRWTPCSAPRVSAMWTNGTFGRVNAEPNVPTTSLFTLAQMVSALHVTTIVILASSRQVCALLAKILRSLMRQILNASSSVLRAFPSYKRTDASPAPNFVPLVLLTTPISALLARRAWVSWSGTMNVLHSVQRVARCSLRRGSRGVKGVERGVKSVRVHRPEYLHKWDQF